MKPACVHLATAKYMVMKRIQHEPAYVLHGYDWSESSRIVELFTRHHGRVAVVAKGAKRPSSNFRAILLPLQLLRVAYGGKAEISTLRSAEWQGGHAMPTGEILLAGYYVNELLMRFLARDDAHTTLFDVYRITIATLVQYAHQRDYLQAALRAFELLLLREVGLLPDLSITPAQQERSTHTSYILHPENGLCAAQAAPHPQERSIHASQWHSLHQAMQSHDAYAKLLTLCVQHRQLALALKGQVRNILLYHCNVSALHTRQLMVQLHNL